MILLIVFAFVAGLVTILSPCILPILPIVLSGSLAGGKKRPLGIVTGFVLSFTFFTLMLATIVKATGLPSDTLRNIAVIMIFFFGLSLVVPQTQVFLEKIFTKLSGLTPRPKEDTGFMGGVLIGVSLGLVWAPCVGPILASVITLAVTNTVTLSAVFITLAYSLGSAVPLLAITYGGRQLLQKVPWLLSSSGKIQKIFGVIMMAMALALYLQVDRQFQTYILEKFPQYGTGLTAVEQNTAVSQELSKLKGGTALAIPDLSAPGTPAPDFTGGGTWINSPPLSLKNELKGKVVLVDFWTYSCINCIRTLPYLRQWYDTYKDKGLVIVGVHSPEFEFEKNTANVTKAVSDFQLKYPVVQDNDFKIWNSYQNQYWPAHYLIDKNGQIRYTHFGEGSYVETENAIRLLLDEKPLQQQEAVTPPTTSMNQTPETYLGYKRAEAYTAQNEIKNDQMQTYSLSDAVEQDAVGLRGDWQVGGESIVAKKDDSTLQLNFYAGAVYLVMGNSATMGTGKVTVTLDGKPLPKENWTADMNDQGEIMITMPRKYDIVDLKNQPGRHVLELHFSIGTEVFAFTFG